MDNFDLYVNLEYGIPKYAIKEILWAMRDEAQSNCEGKYDFFVKWKNSFHIERLNDLGFCLLANARCVGMELECLSVVNSQSDELVIYFNKR